jgi:adenosylhomocysteine nucleosidase
MRCGGQSNGFKRTDMSDSAKARVAIVAALEREVRPLVKRWRASERQQDGRTFRFYEKDEVVVVCGGIGAEAARRAAEAIISIFRPGLIFSAGFAGALGPKLKVGDLVRPHRVIDASDGSSTMLDRGEGILVSFSSVADPAQKVRLRQAFQADAVDMEAAAVARAAHAHAIEFAVIKAVSDEANFDFPSTERFIDSNGKFSEARFALFAAVRPWLWPRVIRLARNSGRASRALAEPLAALAGRTNPSAPARVV